jgi:formylglycine-generating enzyme required for sulfatase activity
MCKRLGLVLPSEAQWEYACRGGTQTPWWTGLELESLNGRVNLGDQAARRAGMKWFEPESWPALEDGWALHAPVGWFGANGLGLHEIIGNVWEWCGEERESYSTPDQVDPFQPWRGGKHEIAGRGGGFGDPGLLLRSAHRDSNQVDNRGANVGLRPARALEG